MRHVGGTTEMAGHAAAEIQRTRLEEELFALLGPFGVFVRIELEHDIGLFDLSDDGNVPSQHLRIGIEDNERATIRPNVNGALDFGAGLDVRFETNIRGQGTDEVVSWSRPDDTFGVGHEIDALSRCQQRARRLVRVASEGLGINEGINSRINLVVASGHGLAERSPVSVASVGAAVRFDKARSVRSQDERTAV